MIDGHIGNDGSDVDIEPESKGENPGNYFRILSLEFSFKRSSLHMLEIWDPSRLFSRHIKKTCPCNMQRFFELQKLKK